MPRYWFAAVGLTLIALCAQAGSQGAGASENQIKAAYLYDFAKLTKWPDSTLLTPTSPVVMGVVGGDDEFISVMERTVDGKSIGGHPLLLKHINKDSELTSCHLLFVRASVGRKRTQNIIAAVAGAGAGILLVGEDDNFLHEGGMINLVQKSGTIRFEVDQQALARARFSLSPDLLAHAESEPSHDSSGDVRNLRHSVLPEYPEVARRIGLKGTVQVELSVQPDGRVKDVRVIGGHPLLVEAFVKVVKEWQYEPAPHESHISVRYVFGQ